ncbi:hypothetical protein [Eikenella sp. NML96-A-049]|nr:hypothetical protein [Eikenella sp. NML96-A-049]
MTDKIILAQDRSLRSYAQDGRLHVASSNISKTGSDTVFEEGYLKILR